MRGPAHTLEGVSRVQMISDDQWELIAPTLPAHTGRLRIVHRHLRDGIAQAHVAAEFRVSRPAVVLWMNRS